VIENLIEAFLITTAYGEGRLWDCCRTRTSRT
jgi:hypothetical protein